MRNRRLQYLLPVLLLPAACNVSLAQSPVQQKEIALVKAMPDLPEPYKMKDWKSIAIRQDKLLYDFEAKGPGLPLIWWDDDHVNFPIRSFGLPSYVGSKHQDLKGASYESLPVIGSVLGASLVGIDKSRQNGYDFVTMCRQFFNRRNGANMIMNNADRKPGRSFWYEIWPGMTFNMLADRYPGNPVLDSLMRINTESWLRVTEGLTKGKDYPDFNYTSFDFTNGTGYYNQRWREPDAAAGLAWLQFCAWQRWKDKKFLDATKACMRFLQERPATDGPYYEIMLPFGAYLAIRMNAELGTGYDELKLLNWCFDGNNTDRKGWGVIAERWGDYDVHGLVGQKQWEQYAFAMNTYAQAAALAPVVKYNPAYARTIGKWMLNLANASRLFYADEHPLNRQTSGYWKGDPEHVICYEGVRKNLDNGNGFQVFKGVLADKGPYAVGDQVKQLKARTDICPYGSAWVGMLGAIVNTTNVEKILKLDCNATDFFGDRAYPTWLYFNPFSESKTIVLPAGNTPVNVYELVSKKFVQKNVQGNTSLEIPAGQAVVIVLVPVSIQTQVKDNRLLADGHVIDYRVE